MEMTLPAKSNKRVPMATNTLTGIAARKRPQKNWDEVRTAAAKKIAVNLEECGCDPIDEYGLEQIKQAIQYDHDGFDIACNLKSDGWELDAQMVEVLDGTYFEIDNACSKLLAAWVESEGIVPRLAIGDKITMVLDNITIDGKKTKREKKSVSAEIVKINSKQAQYHLFVEEFGHVRTGIGTNALINNFEDVEKWMEL